MSFYDMTSLLVLLSDKGTIRLQVSPETQVHVAVHGAAVAARPLLAHSKSALTLSVTQHLSLLSPWE